MIKDKSKNNKTALSEAEITARKRAFSSGTRSMLLSVLAVVLVVAVNLAANLLPDSFKLLETSGDGAFYPSKELKEYIDALPEGQEIAVYMVAPTGGEETKLRLFGDRVADLSPRITMDTIDPDIYPERVAGLTHEAVGPNSLVVCCGDRVRVLQNSEIFVYKYAVDDVTGGYYVESIEFNADELMLSAMKYVLAQSLPTVYILQGHGEAVLSDEYLSALGKENIEYKPLTLLTAGAVPSDCHCLIVNDPAEDISSAEYLMLKNYLEAGGDMLVTTEYNPVDGFPETFMSLLEYFGMSAGDMVFEKNSQYYYDREYYLLPDFCEHDITAALAGSSSLVLMPAAHAIYETGLHRDTVKVTPLLVTDTGAWTGVVSPKGELPTEDSATDKGSFNIGVLAEESYDGVKTRIAWYSTNGIIDETSDQLVAGHNRTLFVGTVGYFCDFDWKAGVGGSSIDINHMIMPAGSARLLTVLVCVILPVAVIVAGVAVYIKRRRA